MIGLALALGAEPDLERLDQALDAVEAAGIGYGEVLVLDGEREVYRRRLGGAPEGGRYRIGSVSKSFTAAAVLQLVDEGALTLDTPVVELLPEIPELGDVRVRHLLNHTSGLMVSQAGSWAVEPTFDVWVQSLRNTAQLVVVDPPGTAFAYNNTGYALATEVVRRKRGGSFEQVLVERLGAPAGLVDTGIRRGPREVEGTVWTPLGRLPARAQLGGLLVHDYRWDFGGDGAITSSVDDLGRWATALREGRVVSEAALGELTTPALDGYAMGWVVQGDHLWHNGALSPLGNYAYLRWSRADERVVVLLNAVDLSCVDPELRVVVEAALASEPLPEVRAQAGPFGWIALASRAYLHWVVGLLPLAGLALWGRRPDRSRAGLVSAAVGALGVAVAWLAWSGLAGVVVAAAGTALAMAGAQGRATAPPAPRWWLGALLGSFVGAAGLGWGMLVLLVLQLWADPWALFLAS